LSLSLCGFLKAAPYTLLQTLSVVRIDDLRIEEEAKKDRVGSSQLRPNIARPSVFVLETRTGIST
jgi:hypothetical protein